MPDPGQPGVFRRLARLAIPCLLLGAILQYAVAAKLGVGEPLTRELARSRRDKPDREWAVRFGEGRWGGLGFQVARFRSLGRDVLNGTVWFISEDRTAPKPDAELVQRQRSWFVLGDSKDEAADEVIADAPPSWSRFSPIQSEPILIESYFQGVHLEVGCGWPTRSTSYYARSTCGCEPFTVKSGHLVSNVISGTGLPPRVIPMHILWPGTIINTLIYATALLIPFNLAACVWTSTRQHLRRRAGRCLACGYDLRATPTGTCPECGAQV